jgi:Fur family ferric uptake transcriptional regulator
MSGEHTGWSDHAERTLARAGHRAGGARAEVVALLAGHQCLLSAQEIHDRLRAGGRRVGLASVYRALDALWTLGLVHRVEVNGTSCYEPADPSGSHHHHAVCDACGSLSTFEDPAIERALDRVAHRMGFDQHAHDIVLRGTCGDCTHTA